jgi:hypothetical protein
VICGVGLAVLVGAAGTAAGSRSTPASHTAGGRATSNSVTFQDSTGEDSAAPDITGVTVSNDDTGMLTFQINIANRPQLVDPMEVDVFLDTDLNSTNGAGPSSDGVELALSRIPGDLAVGRWDGSKWDFSGQSPSSLTYSYANGATIRVKASDLGLTKFNFWVLADSDRHDPNSHVDFAPDAGHGTWQYEVKIAPPPPPPPTTTQAAGTSHPKKTTPKCKKGQKSTAKHPCHK